MSIYLMCFISSCFFIYLAQRNVKNKIIYSVCTFIGIIIPCLLAGLRAYTIGTDVQVYTKPIFECAKYSDSFKSFLNMRITWSRIVSDYEIGFVSLVYITTKIFGNLQAVLFVIHLMIIIPIYMGLKKINGNDKNKIWMGMLIFYLMSFNESLNAMRQYISIAILFCGSCYMMSKAKHGKLIFFVSLGIAYLFHTSALMGIIIYLIYMVVNHKYKKQVLIGNTVVSINKIISIFIILLGVMLTLNTNIIINLLDSIGMDYYSIYINGEVSILTSTLIKVLPVLTIYLIQGKRFLKNDENAQFYILMYIFSILMQQFTTVNVYAGRIAWMFSIFNTLGYPALCFSSTKKYNNKIVSCFLIAYLFFYWYNYFVYNGRCETIPYVFYWNKV